MNEYPEFEDYEREAEEQLAEAVARDRVTQPIIPEQTGDGLVERLIEQITGKPVEYENDLLTVSQVRRIVAALSTRPPVDVEALTSIAQAASGETIAGGQRLISRSRAREIVEAVIASLAPRSSGEMDRE
jgi:hypothetical protein